MKILRLVIGIVVILAIVCSPALAISISDLFAQYQGHSVPTTPIPTDTPTFGAHELYPPVAARTLLPSYYKWSKPFARHAPGPYPNGTIGPYPNGECPPMHYEPGFVR